MLFRFNRNQPDTVSGRNIRIKQNELNIIAGILALLPGEMVQAAFL